MTMVGTLPTGVYNLEGGQYYICLTVKLPRDPSRILSRHSLNVCWLNPGQAFLHQGLLSPAPQGSRAQGAATEWEQPPPSSHWCFLRGSQNVLARCNESATSFFPQIIKCFLHLTTGGLLLNEESQHSNTAVFLALLGKLFGIPGLVRWSRNTSNKTPMDQGS